MTNEGEMLGSFGIPARARDTYDKLARLMLRLTPECTDLDLFTADTISKADAVVMKQICDSCPLQYLCRDFATTAKPTAGFWAGYYHRSYKPRRMGKSNDAA